MTPEKDAFGRWFEQISCQLPDALPSTIKLLNIRTPKKIAVIILKFEQCGFKSTIE